MPQTGDGTTFIRNVALGKTDRGPSAEIEATSPSRVYSLDAFSGRVRLHRLATQPEYLTTLPP